jgi:hypothetical protein
MGIVRERWVEDGSEKAKSDWVFIYGPLVEGGHECFYCGASLDYPLVYWAGYGGFVGMHPECAVRFGGHLIKDGLVATDATFIRARALLPDLPGPGL